MFILKCRGKERNILSIYREFIRLKILESAPQLRAKSYCYAIWLLRREEWRGAGRRTSLLVQNPVEQGSLGEKIFREGTLCYASYMLVRAQQTIAAAGLIGAGWKGSRCQRRQQSVSGRRALVPPCPMAQHPGVYQATERWWFTSENGKRPISDFTLSWTTMEIPAHLARANIHGWRQISILELSLYVIFKSHSTYYLWYAFSQEILFMLILTGIF